MSNGYSSRVWTCPFFQWDERLAVHCEGGSRVRFARLRTYRQYVSCYCCDLNGWRRCSIADALNKQYDDEEDEDDG